MHDFISKYRAADAPLSQVAKQTLTELTRSVQPERARKPPHIPDQRALIADLFNANGPVWMLFFDGGRYDVFDQLVWDYFDGHVHRAWNGGVAYTGDWAERNLSCDCTGRGFFATTPIRYQSQTTFDAREHFDIAPDPGQHDDVAHRLQALGYKDGAAESYSYPPERVNSLVRSHLSDVSGGVIRYLKPHPPLAEIENLTSGTGKAEATRNALNSGAVSYQELTDAYKETYRIGLEAATKLVPELPGKVILTADHGTCLTCGQLFHGRQLQKHDHLTIVPWMEVDQTQ